MIAARGLTVARDGREILHGLDLKVESGHWLAVIGPNGAGKSTLLKALTGLLPATGEISLDGQRTLTTRQRARLVAYAPQNPALPEELTVAQYVLLGRSPYLPYLGRESRHDHEITAAVLDRLDLTGFARRSVGRLSGGERQRVVLARALAQQAPILLLDEPTTALDLGHQQQVLELLDGLRRERGLTLITTLHDLTVAGQYADSLLLLADGWIAALGTPAEVLTAELVALHFGARVIVVPGPAGHPLLSLERP
ncbi:ABC transporter ATP-binding protein [Actinocorallia lasiicapitis]